MAESGQVFYSGFCFKAFRSKLVFQALYVLRVGEVHPVPAYEVFNIIQDNRTGYLGWLKFLTINLGKQFVTRFVAQPVRTTLFKGEYPFRGDIMVDAVDGPFNRETLLDIPTMS